jgi:hypothetical protein
MILYWLVMIPKQEKTNIDSDRSACSDFLLSNSLFMFVILCHEL